MADSDLPTECDRCGSELDIDEDATRPVVDATGGAVTMIMNFRCPNPDCPRNEYEMAKAAPQTP